jgi:hypothetical protein
MPISETTLRELRQSYNAAFTAYQSCLKDVNEATMRSGGASLDLSAKVAEALHELTEARSKLLAALAEAEKDEPAVVVSRPDGVVIEIQREQSGGARLTVDLGCCKKSRKISCDVAKAHDSSPHFDRIVQEMEADLIAAYGPRPLY